MDKIMAVLKEIRPDVDFSGSKPFVDGGLLDSFDMLGLVTELNETFGVRIGVADITADNFNSLNAIDSLLKRLGA